MYSLVVLEYSYFLTPHVQALLGLQPIQVVPWVQEVHAHQQGQKVHAFQTLPVGDTISLEVPFLTV